MRRITSISIATVAVLSACLAFLRAPQDAHACGIAPSRGAEVEIANESALIAYDSATKTQHFLRIAQFNTASSDFGFFVPTPSQPELAEASAEIFPALAKITAPAVVYRTVKRQAEFNCFLMGGNIIAGKSDAYGNAAMPEGASVRVLEKKRIGAFDAVVLKADNAQALQDWLKENEYSTRPALEEWFAEYIRLGWYLAAFKIAAGKATGSVNPAVRISIKTDVPIYPYREPRDQKKDRGGYHPRLLRLFVLSDDRVEGTVGTGAGATPFVGETVWSKPVDSGVLAPVLTAGKFPPIPRDLHLTEFEDRSSPRVGTGDVEFAKAPNQAAVERPPHEIVTVETSYTTVTILAILIGSLPIAILVGALFILRSWRRAV